MKKIIPIILILLVVGCNKPTKTVVFKNTIIDEDSLLVRELDSLTELGEYILVRGSDRNFDTIIDHVRYRHITEE